MKKSMIISTDTDMKKVIELNTFLLFRKHAELL